MGLRGPAPEPTPILAAKGSWLAKTRIGEVEYQKGIPTCPTWLGKEAKAEWKRQVKQLESAGVLQVVDRAALAVYCQAWGEFVQAVEQIRKRTQGEDGELHLDSCFRLVKIKNEASDRVLRMAGQFGFTPAARVRVKATEKPEGQQIGKARFFA